MGVFNRLYNAIRYTDGSYFFTNIGHQKVDVDGYTNQRVALECPILFGAIDKIANYLAQVDFYLENDDNRNDPLIKLLDDPNDFQSKEDFWKEWLFNYIACGYNFIAAISPAGFETNINRVDSIYNLNPKYICYDNFTVQTKFLTRQEIKDAKDLKFRYEVHRGHNGGNITNKTFQYRDIIGFFDVANGVCHDFLLNSPSRIDSVLQASVNVIKAFEAQNIVIKSNGREMFFSEAKGTELGLNRDFNAKDQQEIQLKSRTYGMQHFQNRSIFLNKETGWKSLHIDARELAIYETLKTASMAIATALQVPKELIPVFDNSTYTNQKEAEIQLIQGVIEPIANDICSSLTTFFGYKSKPLLYKVDHLAPMQHIEYLKADKISKLSIAFRNFTQSGMTVDETNELFESVGLNINGND